MMTSREYVRDIRDIVLLHNLKFANPELEPEVDWLIEYIIHIRKPSEEGIMHTFQTNVME